MAVESTDVKIRLSGGAANAVLDASLGGAKSSVEVGTGLHNLFDAVSGAEAAAGDTEYRCVYIHNAHATLAMQGTKIWVSSNTPSPGTTAEIALGASAINGTETAVANEGTAPSGPVFSAPAVEGSALVIGDIPAGQHKAIWIKRIVSAAAAAYANDTFSLTIKWDTAA